MLDVGTGSGCIAVAIAFYCDGVIVDATDAAPDALELASENVREHGCADRVRLWQADLFPPREDRYRVIISNPPYVPADVLPSLPAEYAHEPVHGLDGGNDGLEPTHRLLAGASERLTDDGVLIVEVGEAADALSAAYPRLPVVWLSFDRGGEGVFLVTSDQLRAAGL